jgi:hypothetical protein
MPVQNWRARDVLAREFNVDRVGADESSSPLCRTAQDSGLVEIRGEATNCRGVPLSGLAFLMYP